MNKIAVLATVGESYRFTFANYVRLLAILWFPFVLIFAGMAVVAGPVMDAMRKAAQGPNLSAAMGMLGEIFLFEFVALFVVVVASLGVTRLALGRPVRWPFFYFSLDRTLWRLLLADLVAGLIMFGILMAVSIVSGIVLVAMLISSGASAQDPAAAQHLALMQQLVVTPIVYLAMAVIYIRVGYLLPGIVSDEAGLGISRNWALTKGNFWRLLGLLVLIVLPMVILSALNYLVIWHFAGNPFDAMSHAGDPRAQMGRALTIFAFYARYWYVYAIVSLLLAPLFYGPLFASGAFAYRALAEVKA